jgi:hypothetical protein
MKRVLNSGFIKLHSIRGTEKEILGTLSGEQVCKLFQEYLFKIEFRFEVKAPLLTLLAFQDANLGTITKPEDSDHQVAYLPSQFYSQDDLTYTIMDDKACNAYYTKLNNFFEWSFNFYNKLIKEGMCKSQAALVLPQGIFTTFMWDLNASDLINFIDDNWNSSPEMYGYCSTLVLYLEEHLPEITKYLKANRWKNIGL